MKEEVKLFWILLGVGGLGGFIFGYSSGVIAGALPAMQNTMTLLQTSGLAQGIVTTSLLLGAVIGSAFGSSVGSRINKKRSVVLIGIFTIVGSLGSAFSPGLGLIVLSREILGVGVGLASSICPTYVAELAPRRFAGALGSWFQVSLTFGIFASYLINISFANVIYDFRWMFGLGAIPGVLICLMYFVMPLPPSDRPTTTFPDEDSSINQYGESRLSGPKTLFKMCTQQTWAVLLGIVLAMTLQFTGINAVLYYAPTIFSNAGLSGDTSSLLATLGVGGWNFLSTFVAIFLVDRLGRRPLLLSGLAVLVLSCVALGFTFQFAHGTIGGIVSIVLMLVYITGFEAGIGSLFWPLLTETFPPEYRETGGAIMNVLQWTFNIILTMSFPSLISIFSQAIVFWGFSAIGLFCFVFLFFRLKETGGKASTYDKNFDPNYQFTGNFDEKILSDSDHDYNPLA